MLTPAGEMVVKKAQAMLEIEKSLQDELQKFTGRQSLSICCTPSFGTAFLPGVLNCFMQRNADTVDLKFMFSTPEQAVKGLAERDFDIGIIEHCDGLDLSEFQKVDLPKDELVFISSPSLGIPSPIADIEQLKAQRLIARKDGCSSKKLLRHNLSAMGCEIEDFRSTVIYDDLRLTVETVLAGGGISFVSTSLVRKQLDEQTLREHRVEGFCHNRYRTVAVSRRKFNDPFVKDFLMCVKTEFDELCMN